MDPTLQDVYSARRRLAGLITPTPLEPSPSLAHVAGRAVHLKLECWQRTRSFKARGALNAVLCLGESAREQGLVTASAGNHGQGLALAAGLAGARTTVFAPASSPETKRRRIRALGAALELVDGSYDDAAAAAREFARRTGARLVHPFTDPAVIAGQGTVALEILDLLPEVGTVVVPVGGGGLIAGIGMVLKRVSGGRVRVVGAQSERTDAMHAAFAAGRPLPRPVRPTLADGLAGEVEPESYRRAAAVTDEMVLVTETAIADAIRALYHDHGVVAEGAGAVAAAAIMEDRVAGGGPVVAIISGGNIDAASLAKLLTEA